jgi:hypothetical protein
MVSLLTEVVTRSADSIAVEAIVRIARHLVVTETDDVRPVVVAVAQSVFDSWD